MVQAIISPEMSSKVEVTLFGEEEQRAHPAILAIYGLDGNLYTYYVYLEDQPQFQPIRKAN